MPHESDHPETPLLTSQVGYDSCGLGKRFSMSSDFDEPRDCRQTPFKMRIAHVAKGFVGHCYFISLFKDRSFLHFSCFVRSMEDKDLQR